MLFIFDTNIVLLYLRESLIVGFIESKFKPFDAPNESVISVVTVAELKSIAIQNKWGSFRIRKMENFSSKFVITDISNEEILNRYAEIDAFSQGRLDGKASNFSARNMGKNDVWIAATASILDAMLLTADNDFDHLHEEFLTLEKISLSENI